MLTTLVRSFAEETAIFGLNLFQRKRSTLYTIVWCTIVLVFSLYTTKNLVSITSNYLNEETVTFVEQKTDDDFVIPFPLLYLLISTAGHAEGVNRSVLQRIASEDDFLKNATAFRYSIDFLRRLNRAEGEARQADIGTVLAADSDLVEDLKLLANPRIPSLAQLKKIILLKVCEALQIRIRYPNAPNETTVCASERLSFVYHQNEPNSGSALIGLSLDQSQMVFRQKYDTFTVRLDVAQLADEFGLELQVSSINFPKSELSSQNITTVDVATIPLTVGVRAAFYVQKNAEYRNLNLARQPCDDDISRSTRCENLCGSRLFHGSHGCWALLYTYQLSPLLQNISGVRECDANDYLHFVSVRTSSSAQKRFDCIAKCIRPCSRIIYVADGFSPPLRIANSTSVAEASFTIGSHEYPVFQERFAKDLETFFGDFGGALGLWLGASFASLVHIPLFLLDAIINFYRKKKKLPFEDHGMTESQASGVDIPATVVVLSTETVRTVSKMAVDLENIFGRLQALEDAK